MAVSGVYVMCQICESCHGSIDELNAHYESEHLTTKEVKAEKKFKCKFCDKKYTQRSNMYTHQRNAHGRVHYEVVNPPIQPNEDGRFPCEFCDKSFSRKESVYKHQRRVHGRESEKLRKRNQGTVPCNLCDKMFFDSSAVKKHMKIVHK